MPSAMTRVSEENSRFFKDLVTEIPDSSYDLVELHRINTKQKKHSRCYSMPCLLLKNTQYIVDVYLNAYFWLKAVNQLTAHSAT